MRLIFVAFQEDILFIHFGMTACTVSVGCPSGALERTPSLQFNAVEDETNYQQSWRGLSGIRNTWIHHKKNRPFGVYVYETARLYKNYRCASTGYCEYRLFLRGWSPSLRDDGLCSKSVTFSISSNATVTPYPLKCHIINKLNITRIQNIIRYTRGPYKNDKETSPAISESSNDSVAQRVQRSWIWRGIN